MHNCWYLLHNIKAVNCHNAEKMATAALHKGGALQHCRKAGNTAQQKGRDCSTAEQLGTAELQKGWEL